METEWFDSLKVGDEVCYTYRFGGYTFTKIKNITPTGLVKTESGKTFKNGRCRHDSWETLFLEPVTQEIINNVREAKLKVKLRNFNFNSLKLDHLERINTIIEEEPQ